MSFRFGNLENLGSQLSITIPPDGEGYLGRECPEDACLGHFKVKLGTGLTGPSLPCHCPYCGDEGASNQFWTNEQLAYAESQAMNTVSQAITADLKRLEFDHRPRGSLGIGLSLKVTGGGPIPIRHYREKTLETHVTCSRCTLEYAIYGVLAYCPDCGTHNSQQILEKNLNLVGKQLAFSDQATDADFRRQLIEDALENCVSALDGFGREACRVRANRSNDAPKCAAMSFQNLSGASKIVKGLFGVDLRAAIESTKWDLAHRGFMKRHLISHRSGVIDQKYIDETKDFSAVVGRKVVVTAAEVSDVATATLEIGLQLIRLLPPPDRS